VSEDRFVGTSIDSNGGVGDIELTLTKKSSSAGSGSPEVLEEEHKKDPPDGVPRFGQPR
jgi:hypothetical protein